MAILSSPRCRSLRGRRGWITRARRGVGVAAGLIALTMLSHSPAHAEQAWVWPTSGDAASSPVIARDFDPPQQPWLSGHRGVDLLATAGSPVHAAGPGRAIFAGAVAGRGIVVIEHGDGTRTTYEPVHVLVRRGSAVRRGQQIGHLSAAGGHCLPATCLHWGRLRGNDYLDPLALMRGAGPARLLPVWTPPGPGPPQPDGRHGIATRSRPRVGPADAHDTLRPFGGMLAATAVHHPSPLLWGGIAAAALITAARRGRRLRGGRRQRRHP